MFCGCEVGGIDGKMQYESIFTSRVIRYCVVVCASNGIAFAVKLIVFAITDGCIDSRSLWGCGNDYEVVDRVTTADCLEGIPINTASVDCLTMPIV